MTRPNLVSGRHLPLCVLLLLSIIISLPTSTILLRLVFCSFPMIIRRPFGKLRSDIVIKRLIECDFPPEAIKWISDYLRDKSQVARIGATESKAVKVSSGVTQGVILGPFLYSFATATYVPQSTTYQVV